MFSRVLIFLFFTISSLFGVGLTMDSFKVIPQSDGFKIHIEFTAYGLNTPIPERDDVVATFEVRKSQDASYPKLATYYNVAKGCKVDNSNKCLKKKSSGVEILTLGNNVIRPPQVWLKYGGLGEWKKRAPNVVSGSIDAFIPAKYQGRSGRLHLTLTHVIGGPNAAWPGISYYHQTTWLDLPYLDTDTNSSNIKVANIISSESNTSQNSVDLNLWVDCEGYKKRVAFLEIVDVDKVSKIVLEGFLRDYKSRLIKQKCEMSIDSPLIETTFYSDINGTYRYVIDVNPKGWVDYERENFFLEKNVTKVIAKVIGKPKLIANGKLYNIKVKFFANSEPLKNSTLFLSYKEGGIAKKGKLDAIYVDVPKYWLQTVTTNSSGVAEIFIDAPKANLVRLLNPESFFPVYTPISIFIYDKQDIYRKVGEMGLNWASPYPIITKFLVPDGMMAQHWQTNPSIIDIKDNDSKVFDVKIYTKGRLRLKGKKVSKDYLHLSNVDKMPITFYYASPPLGLDLNNQPDIKKALYDVTVKEVLVNFGIFSLEFVRDVKKSLKYIDWLKKSLTKENKVIDTTIKQVLPGTLKVINDSYGLGTVYYTKYDTKKAKMYDSAVGGLLLVLDAISIVNSELLTPQQLLALEVAKALYSYGKVFISAYDRYGKIINSYEDIVLVPVMVRVTDSDGYQALKIKSCAVRIFKGEKE